MFYGCIMNTVNVKCYQSMLVNVVAVGKTAQDGLWCCSLEFFFPHEKNFMNQTPCPAE